MHKGNSFIVGVVRLYMFRRMRPSSGGIVYYQAAKVVLLDFGRGEGCVGSGGVETCCS
jgi:hypothetical protein